MSNEVEFVKLPDGRIAAVVDVEQENGFTSGGNIRIAKTDGAGAQVMPGVYIAVNAWRKLPKEKTVKLHPVAELKF